MKRLIVCTALLTLLASMSGCSILRKPRAKSCNTAPPVRATKGWGFGSWSMPWQSTPATSDPGNCSTCNSAGTVPLETTIVPGGTAIPTSPLPDETYYPSGIVTQGTVVEKPVYEVVPAPVISPELGVKE